MRFFFLLLFAFSSLTAQRNDAPIQEGELIPLRTLVTLANPQANAKDIAGAATAVSLISRQYGIYQFSYTNEAVWNREFARLASNPEITSIQHDYRVTFRREPNDEFYNRQPNLERMGFPDIWTKTTGGLTPNGDQIVIAVLDSGFDTDHPDLIDNLWNNSAEIPGDGIDNDNNGFRDDMNGWNFARDQASATNDQHGTSVLGIMGARGDNEIGIAGTSWGNKMMLLTIDDVSDIIGAYDYVIEQRRRWNQSNGSQGALVVATNASFGIEGQFCSNYPIWGAMYDRLGEQGVLTAAGAANRSWDVDEWGDMPTTCTSDYLIGVANLGENDRLWRSSAWGSTSIDLVATGQGSYTTSSNGLYTGFGNNSAAAPYVTGAIALLYSLPCERISGLTKTEPAIAARLMRQALLRTVDEKPSVRQLINTGGLLDMVAASNYLTDLCAASDSEELAVSRVYPNPAHQYFQLEFGDPSLGPYILEFVDMAGRVVRQLQLPAESALPFSNRIATTGMARGIYLLRLSNQRSTVLTKVVIQ